jgi:hypothetical protein
MISKTTSIALAAALVGCNLLEPRVDDVTADAPRAPRPDAAVAPDAASHILPAGSSVPAIADNAELVNQIKTYCGLSSSTITSGRITRSTGKAAAATVMYWDFGRASVAGSFAVVAPLYVLADPDGAGGYIPRTDHPYLIDTIPGDPAYAAVRRMLYVPVTASYAGEQLTSLEALAEALERGLVGEPVPAGTWRNMPVVPPGIKLELGGTAADLDATVVYGRGYRVELFPLGGALGLQPLKSGAVPIGHESRLLSGVPTGSPPALPVALDAQPVFQYGIPGAAPTTDFNYTPLVTELDVRLASIDTDSDGIPDTVLPSAITSDADLFRRSSSCSSASNCRAIQGYLTGTVASYTVTTTVSNKQIQFALGEP